MKKAPVARSLFLKIEPRCAIVSIFFFGALDAFLGANLDARVAIGALGRVNHVAVFIFADRLLFALRFAGPTGNAILRHN
jgi:hypothetical protein